MTSIILNNTGNTATWTSSCCRSASLLCPCITHKTGWCNCWNQFSPACFQLSSCTLQDITWCYNGWPECRLLVCVQDCIQCTTTVHQHQLHLVDWQQQWHHNQWYSLCIWQVFQPLFLFYHLLHGCSCSSRIITYTGLTEYVVPGSASVVRFDSDLGLTVDQVCTYVCMYMYVLRLRLTQMDK